MLYGAEDLGDVQLVNWTPGAQAYQPPPGVGLHLPGEVVVEDGDLLTTTCTYENTTDHDVFYGTGANEEMCFDYVLYYPWQGLRCVAPF